MQFDHDEFLSFSRVDEVIRDAHGVCLLHVSLAMKASGDDFFPGLALQLASRITSRRR
jgi:hypothetical protein